MSAIVGDGKSSPTRDGRYGHTEQAGISESPRIASMCASIVNATVIGEESNGTRSIGDRSKANIIGEINERGDEGLGRVGGGQSNHLQPAFYTPSIYSITFDAPQFRPSHNVSLFLCIAARSLKSIYSPTFFITNFDCARFNALEIHLIGPLNDVFMAPNFTST